MSRRPAVAALAGILAACAASACGPSVDLKQALQVTDVSSGWFDAGIQDGKNKLVPSVTFKLKKNADVNLSSVSLNLTFRFTGAQDQIDEVYVQSVLFEGSETAPVTARTKWGYTADPPQTRAEMLKHSEFRDTEVQIFAKRGSTQWTELQRVTIARQLLTQ
jgi:hypothetical protein